MISICSTCYHETDQLEIFIRSVIGNATNPNDLEIIIVNDEAWGPTEEILIKLEEEFKQLQHINFPKKDRIKFLRGVVDFYDGTRIFPAKYIPGMRTQIDKYESGEIERLWYPAGGKFNMAANKAKGDTIIFCPSDYLVICDVTLLSQRLLSFTDEFKEMHFDWYDFTSLDPYPDYLAELKEGDIRRKSIQWFYQALKDGVSMVHMQHGARILTSNLYPLTKGFDDRWFIRALTEDLFNLSAQIYAPGKHRIMDYPLTDTYPFMGPVRNYKPHPIVYLSPDYDGNPETHNAFKEDIKHYLSKGVGLYVAEN
jgi:hypothetical protein